MAAARTAQRLEASDSQVVPVHNIFRYPAKFHAPLANALIKRYTVPGDRILDPFCGSGTLMVEALRTGRNSVGSDVDPLAVFVSEAKTTSPKSLTLTEDTTEIGLKIAELSRGRQWYTAKSSSDITDADFDSEIANKKPPAIPNLHHWFRRYVISDLLTIREQILTASISNESRRVLLLAFAASIRPASNADPVPISGLEVTSHMRRKEEEGRIVDPFAIFDKKLRRTINSIVSFAELVVTGATTAVSASDARLPRHDGPFDAIITSPPYQNAVDYYRRHQLEMYWLELTETHQDRLALLPKYLGRPRVPESHPDAVPSQLTSGLVHQWELRIEAESVSRARDFRAYFQAMRQCMQSMTSALTEDGRLIVVVGRSRWGDIEIPVEALFRELAPPELYFDEHLTYPIKNRHMSYARRNGASIDEEQVLAFTRRDRGVT